MSYILYQIILHKSRHLFWSYLRVTMNVEKPCHWTLVYLNGCLEKLKPRAFIFALDQLQILLIRPDTQPLNQIIFLWEEISLSFKICYRVLVNRNWLSFISRINISFNTCNLALFSLNYDSLARNVQHIKKKRIKRWTILRF